jgi:hypothetical protein
MAAATSHSGLMGGGPPFPDGEVGHGWSMWRGTQYVGGLETQQRAQGGLIPRRDGLGQPVETSPQPTPHPIRRQQRRGDDQVTPEDSRRGVRLGGCCDSLCARPSTRRANRPASSTTEKLRGPCRSRRAREEERADPVGSYPPSEGGERWLRIR